MILLIFDIDGTLVRTIDRHDSRCFADAYEKVYGQVFPTIDWTRYPHVTDTSIFETVIREHFQRIPEAGERDAFEEIYLALMRERRKQEPHSFMEVAGAGRLLEQLLAHPDYALGIATGGWERPAEVKLSHVGLPTTAFPIYGADGRMTRHQIIQDLMSKIGEEHPEFEKVVYIGDAVWDVITTRDLQLNFIGMRYGGDRELLMREGAAEVLVDYLDWEIFREAVDRCTPPGRRKKKAF